MYQLKKISGNVVREAQSSDKNTYKTNKIRKTYLKQCLYYSIVACCVISAFSPPAEAKPQQSSTTDVPQVVKAVQNKYGLPPTTPVTVVTELKMPATTLADLVDLQRIAFPQAWVSSTFYDYRSVSRYRRNPGLHLGYDIAMPAGAAVRVGWPGTVVSIAPWSDVEWGVTVESPDGSEVTYGHIFPGVTVGRALNVGDIVGHVAIDHVDVKMRGPNGEYVAFGEGKGRGMHVGYTYTKVMPQSTSEQLMVAWLMSRNTLDTLKMEQEARVRELDLAKVLRDRLEARYADLRKNVKLMREYYQQGLVSRRDVEQSYQDLEKERKQLRTVKNNQKDLPKRLDELKKLVKDAQEKESLAAKKANARGISWNNVNNFVNSLVAKDAKLSKTVKDYKKENENKNNDKIAALKKDIINQQNLIKEQEELYKMGGLPRTEMESSQAKLKLLKEELEALKSGK